MSCSLSFSFLNLDVNFKQEKKLLAFKNFLKFDISCSSRDLDKCQAMAQSLSPGVWCVNPGPAPLGDKGTGLPL